VAARMYDPATGRWLVPDPAAQHFNPYLAMGNCPNMSVDPTGLWNIDPNHYYYNSGGSYSHMVETNLPDQFYVNHCPVNYWYGGYDDIGNFQMTNTMFDSHVNIMIARDHFLLQTNTNPSAGQESTHSSNGDSAAENNTDAPGNKGKWGFSEIDLTLNWSANAGGAIAYQGFGASANYAGVVVVGLKDSKWYFGGNNNGERHVFNGYSVGTPLLTSTATTVAQTIFSESMSTSFEYEEMRIGGKDGFLAYEKHKSTTLGFWYTEQTRDYIHNTQNSQMGFEWGWTSGLGIVFDGSIQIPIYSE